MAEANKEGHNALSTNGKRRPHWASTCSNGRPMAHGMAQTENRGHLYKRRTNGICINGRPTAFVQTADQRHLYTTEDQRHLYKRRTNGFCRNGRPTAFVQTKDQRHLYKRQTRAFVLSQDRRQMCCQGTTALVWKAALG